MQHPARLLLLTSALTDGAAGSLASCTSSSESPADAGVDAAPLPASVTVRCPATVAAEVDAINPAADNYIPMSVTIPKGGVVRFNIEGEHTAKSLPYVWEITRVSDTMCVKFNTTGTHEFFCNAHGFRGFVVVK